MSAGFLESTNPRIRSCARCARLPERCVCDIRATVAFTHQVCKEPGMRARNFELERKLTAVAARAVGLQDTRGIDEFADARAWSGGVREELDPSREICEELADARNYAIWGIEQIWAEVEVGDSDAVRDYDRLMRALSHILAAWSALVVR